MPDATGSEVQGGGSGMGVCICLGLFPPGKCPVDRCEVAGQKQQQNLLPLVVAPAQSMR